MQLTILLSLIFILAILLMLYSAVALIQDKKLFGSAPKDIQEVIQPKQQRFNGQHILGWILLVFSMLTIGAVFVAAVWNGKNNNYGFWQYFVRFVAILYIYKAFDMTFLDWFLLQKTHFFQHYYPETEGCKGFRSYGFNIKSQLTKIIVFPFFSAFAAWLCTLIW